MNIGKVFGGRMKNELGLKITQRKFRSKTNSHGDIIGSITYATSTDEPTIIF